MFDLVDECGTDLKTYGYRIKKLDKFDMTYAFMSVSSDADKKNTGLDKGDYHILNCPLLYDYDDFSVAKFLKENLIKVLKKTFRTMKIVLSSRILIVGLGNPDIACDRLGKEVFDGVEINPLDKKNRLFKFCPNIYFSTGIQAQRLIEMFVQEMKIDLVILIDALTTNSLSRIGKSFQVTTSGITPGSGVNRFGKSITNQSIGAKCLSIGVPFMIFSSDLKNNEHEIILTPKDVAQDIALCGRIISSSLNEVLR